MSVYSFVKKVFCFCLLLLSFNIIRAQQVKKVDCCGDINTKATIIINDNASNAATLTSPGTVNTSFNFKLSGSANTSAGVYNTDGSLIRTLWSGVRYDAGCYVGQWDGLLNDGTQAAYGSYNIKLLSNNISSTWCTGIIGNTSTDLTGDGVINAAPVNMCFSVAKGYATNGYSEHGAVLKSFDLTDPNKYTNLRYNMTTQSTNQMWTDGNIIYCGGGVQLGYDANMNINQNNWVYAQYTSANGDPNTGIVAFPSGVVEDSNNNGSGNVHYDHALSVTKTDYKGVISAMEGQQSGNFLFVARNLKNELQVIDRRASSGALLQTLTYPNIKGIGCDASTFIYIVYNNAVHKLTINSDGTLTDTGINFTGITTPGCLAVSPDGSKIAVADDDTKQVKFYGPAGGAAVYVLGAAGGYGTSPLAGDARFFSINYIKFQKDGSFWVGDVPYDNDHNLSNNRAVHFNNNYSYKESSQHIPSFRSAHIDLNNATRYFANFLEFRRDYSKPLDNGKNGSWKFYANWGGKIQGYDIFQRFGQVVTLGNGRTYAYAGGQIYELDEATGARATGVYLSNNQKLGKDGSLFTINNIDNAQDQVTVQTISFDASNNPVFSSPTVFATSPYNNNHNFGQVPATPYDFGVGFSATSPRYIFYNGSSPWSQTKDDPTINWHLGSVLKGQNKYEWVTARGTATDYVGDYPANGDIDIGNGYPTAHAGGNLMMVGRFAIIQIASEFWKNYTGGAFQNNLHNIYYDNGLFLAQGGSTGQKSNLLGSPAPMAAGNAFATDAVLGPNGNITLAYCDEGQHGGIGTFEISGLETIKETVVPITIKAPITLTEDKTNLMRGLPFRSQNFTGGNGWSLNRQPDANFNVKTSVLTYKPDNIDVFVTGTSNSESYVLRSLEDQGANNTNNYLLTGKMCWFTGKSYPGYEGVRYQVLDVNGKVLIDFNVLMDSGNGYLQSVKINGVTVQSGFEYLPFASFIQIPQNFSVKNINGLLTVSYAGYSTTVNTPFESGGDLNKPSNFKVRVSGNAQLGISELKFVK